MFYTELTPEEHKLVTTMEKFGAVLEGDFFIVVKNNLNEFIKSNKEAYEKASKIVAPTSKQLWMVLEIIEKGVPYEDNVFKYMYDAYNFIGQHIHLIQKNTAQVPPSEWCGVFNH